jgi:hypothetical protein
LTLCVVIALHGGVIWSLFSVGPAGNPARATASSVAVLLLPVTQPPRIRSDPAPLNHINRNAVRALPPTAFGALPMAAATASPAGGSGSRVDWAAEARRALRAYEIRSVRPPSNTSVSGESEDEWLRQLAHHAGDQVRTPNGDWIIWISADCYQVAKSGTGSYAAGNPAPQTSCPDRSHAPTE